MSSVSPTKLCTSFIERIIVRDLEKGLYPAIQTRFPPEPNGYLHLGHLKAIYLNFELAKKYGGQCVLRMDDTDPAKETVEYIEAIKRDVSWLGYKWDDFRYTSDYFEQFYEYALQLIRAGLAYVDRSTALELRGMRGSYSSEGVASFFRDTPVEENLSEFQKMKDGFYREGEAILRAKIDLSSGNLIMRDPVLYRIKEMTHPHRGDEWVIYPMYDFAHPLSDAIEGTTHSLCTLEFQDNRMFYNWLLDVLGFIRRPYQYEFSRLNVEGYNLSKRRLNELVKTGAVESWDDPRMPTIAGLRNRGIPPDALLEFSSKLGYSKQDNSLIPTALLEGSIRRVLNASSKRGFAVVKPLRVVITNLVSPIAIKAPISNSVEGHDERRVISLEKDIYISREDFRETKEPGYRRLLPGSVGRLRYGCVIKVDRVIMGDDGLVDHLEVSADLNSIGTESALLGKPTCVIHWVSASDAVPAEFRFYEILWVYNQDSGAFSFNKNSCKVSVGIVSRVLLDEMMGEVGSCYPYQFEREGYFVLDKYSQDGRALFHRTASLS